MYIINEEKFSPNEGIDNLLKQIQIFLHDNKLVLTDSRGVPLSEEEIVNIISNNQTYNFNTINVSDLEKEFINEMIEYVERVEKNFKAITDSTDNGFIINSFIDLTNSMMEIIGAAEYFKIQFVTINHINEIVNKSLSRIEKGDIDFIIDVMEYEIIPILQDFKTTLLERQYH